VLPTSLRNRRAKCRGLNRRRFAGFATLLIDRDAGIAPGIPQHVHPVIALVTAGVEMDVLGLNYREFSDAERAAVVQDSGAAISAA